MKWVRLEKEIKEDIIENLRRKAIEKQKNVKIVGKNKRSIRKLC